MEKLDKQVKFQIETLLTTDEDRTDAELLEYLMSEFNIDKTQAKCFVSQRGEALSDPNDFKLRMK